jgi:hypothetical protein
MKSGLPKIDASTGVKNTKSKTNMAAEGESMILSLAMQRHNQTEIPNNG